MNNLKDVPAQVVLYSRTRFKGNYWGPIRAEIRNHLHLQATSGASSVSFLTSLRCARVGGLFFFFLFYTIQPWDRIVCHATIATRVFLQHQHVTYKCVFVATAPPQHSEPDLTSG